MDRPLPALPLHPLKKVSWHTSTSRQNSKYKFGNLVPLNIELWSIYLLSKWKLDGVQCEHRFEAGKLSRPTHVYHGDGAGKQEGKNERYSGEDVACGQSGCCGGEYAGDAGSTGGVKEAFEKHGMRMNMEKTEVLWVRQQRK